MKSSRKSKFIAILAVALMLGMNSNSAFALGHRAHKPGKTCTTKKPGNNVGAPLDGGILTILLGGAGAAYFAMKKKKKEQ